MFFAVSIDENAWSQKQPLLFVMDAAQFTLCLYDLLTRETISEWRNDTNQRAIVSYSTWIWKEVIHDCDHATEWWWIKWVMEINMCAEWLGIEKNIIYM